MSRQFSFFFFGPLVPLEIAFMKVLTNRPNGLLSTELRRLLTTEMHDQAAANR